MTIDLYYMPISAPCRSVMLLAKALGVDLNLKKTNLMAGEHLTPEYLKMNICHTIPTMDDNGFYMRESRAILQYLVNAYGKDSELYPTDPKKRAQVDQMLFFDSGTLYDRFGNLIYPVVFGAEEKLSPEKKAKLEEALGWLDHFIKANGGWAAGDKMTIADHTLVATVSSIVETEAADISKYANVVAWFKQCKEQMPGYDECNGNGAKDYGGWIKSKTAGK